MEKKNPITNAEIIAMMRYGYFESMKELAGDSNRMKAVFEQKPKGYIHYDFPEYEVLVSDGSEIYMIPGDRLVRAKDGSFHMIFRALDGFTAKWGRTKDENPTHCPFGNEIADIEITTSCYGIRDKDGNRAPCMFCYKSNQPNGLYMKFEDFKRVFDLMSQPKTMTQIAFGVDAECKTNPDVWKIMDCCREHRVIPNVTVADIDDQTAENIVKRCGACAVSAYERNIRCCYESIINLARHRARLKKPNFKINIHCLLSEETKDLAWRLLDDYVAVHEKSDGKECKFALREINAIVFLSLKQKGRGEGFHILSEDEYRKIIDFCFEHHIPFGMDSCGANKFLRAVEGRSDFNKIEEMVEECESTRCSFYLNAEGRAFPCSFMEGENGWKDGINLLDSKVSDYGKEIWHHPKVEEFRGTALKCIECKGRNQCPHYKV